MSILEHISRSIPSFSFTGSLPTKIIALPYLLSNHHHPTSLSQPPSTSTMAAAATSFEAAAQKLLNPNGDEFDVSLLDDVIAAAYSPSDPNRALANKALMALQETPNVWTKADAILERAQNPQSRFFGLQVLDDAIRTRYGDLYVCVYIYLFAIAIGGSS